jgi:hypothetical protein
LLSTQRTLEDQYHNYAKKTNRNCVILCDRGFMDGSAYVNPDDWSRLLTEMGLDPISARDSRYDAVFHLVTAADGAEKFYTLEVSKVYDPYQGYATIMKCFHPSTRTILPEVSLLRRL